ncbi:hypothetical protein SYN63AY4M2_08970 [Synechococcus sp. 63AY4M2]|jgi:hypothetical protein|nr:hypothetical protein SYN65AY6A5_12620 [Synechococcus sp. 65AY6A5]PIK86551.1 hypothetical protein SYN63AY4M2_08970 [Synechococcus sp. 63AY4M2]PIK95618.1 hypothetical protein SYN60AY4M2_09590 [Synechococcus sp. 60AY4M2]PIK97859.1 hypothetical protein SYN63AY4M1_06990 [Synechococcus sp. 63AY4M1]PIL01416.1 hypothetical protein SYN65AY640_07065 [Synechococcus sp. 65AY640]
MSGLDPAGNLQGSRQLRFGRMRQAWVWGFYPLLWLLTWVGSRSAQPQFLGIPAWYWLAGLAVLLLVPLNFYIVRVCWPGDD